MDALVNTFHLPFHAFVDRALAGDVSEDIVAFVLNLYEGTETFDAQLVGDTHFDSTSSSWCIDPAFSTGEYVFAVSRRLLDDSWENALNLFRALLLDYAARGIRGDRLRRAEAVAVGFVDGDLTLVDAGAARAASREDLSAAGGGGCLGTV